VPGEILRDNGYVGLFGKLPATGDFVSRGLPDAFRSRWDDWVTRHLALRPEPWPVGGLRFRLCSGESAAAGIVLPSRDRVGRRFPLSALLVLSFCPMTGAVDRWCEAALSGVAGALSEGLSADSLWSCLEEIPRPSDEDPDPEPLLLWTTSLGPVAADPSEPGNALRELLSSRGSLTR
jgi:type VI secretion system protein ImpM